MPTQEGLPSVGVAPREQLDQRTRQRIAANMRRLKWQWQFESDAAMAEKCGVSRDAINRALKGERTVGLDLVIKIHRALDCSLDWLIEDEPKDARWFDPSYRPVGKPTK
jgi:transcriptional regulator with XRE-family HTH domain